MTAEQEPKPFVNQDRYPGDYGHHDDFSVVDFPDEDTSYLDEFDEEISGETYAWGKTAYYICEPHFLYSYINTRGPFAMADLCSAFPVTAQIFRDHHRELQFGHARNIVTDLINSIQSFPAFTNLDERHRDRLIKELTKKASRTRRYLTIATLDLLTTPPIPLDKIEAQDADVKKAIAMDLYLKFISHFNIGGKIIDLKKYEQAPPSLFEGWSRRTLESLLEEKADIRSLDLMLQLAQYLVERCIPEYRRFRALSIDSEDPLLLDLASEDGFPQSFRETDVFRRARNNMGSYHIEGDVFHLPLLPESLSFINSTEGYPFYFPELSLADHLAFTQSIIDTLKPGGRAVFFPWHIRDSSFEDYRNLIKAEEYLRKKGMELIKERHFKLTLLGQMGDREQDLASHSPLFTEDPLRFYFTSLTVVKPKDWVSQKEAGSREKGGEF